METELKAAYSPEYKSAFFIIIAAIIYCQSSFYFGYTMVYFNSIDYSDIERIYEVTLDQGIGEGLLSGAVSFGAVFGAISQNIILKVFGRKHCFFFSNLMAIIGGVCVMIPNMPFLLIGRLIQGWVVGIMSGILGIFLKQFTPLSLSGVTGAFQNLFIAIGFLMAFSLSYALSKFIAVDQYLPIVFGFSFLTTIFQQIVLMTILTNETPKYLLMKGRDEEAFELIERMYKPEFVEEIYQQKIKDLEVSPEKENQNERVLPQDSAKAKGFGFLIAIFQQLTGINIIVLYGSELAEGFFPSLKKQVPLLIQIQKLLVSLIGIMLISKYGRKKLMEVGTFFIFLALVGFTVAFWLNQSSTEETQGAINMVILISFIVYVFSFVTTYGPIMWLYIPEIVQPNIVPYIIFCQWVTCCLVITLFPIVRESCGNLTCPPIFLFFAICTLIMRILVGKLMVETKGKTQLQIREEYNMLEIKFC